MFEHSFSPNFLAHGSAGKDHGGVASYLEQLLTFLESLSGRSGAENFDALMPGLSAMENLHPLVVHFPIALIFVFFLIEIIGILVKHENLRKLASLCLYLGAISAAVTVAFGISAAESVAHNDHVHKIMERHEYLGISVCVLSFILSLWRLALGGVVKGFANIPFLFFSIILVALLTLTADLGGFMVYQYGVAVKQAEAPSVLDFFKEHDDHSHSHSHSDSHQH